MDVAETKYYCPPLDISATISRAGSILPGRQEKTIVLLTGPPGYGKTTVISEWVGQSVRRSIYISLDYLENELIRFWRIIIEGISRQFTDREIAALRILTSEQKPRMESVIISLVNDMVLISEPMTLILDDLHEIKSMAIYNSLDFFIDNLPPSVQLILSGRETPPLGLARLRVSGLLKEISHSELKFTEEESSQFLTSSVDAVLDEEILAAVYQKTEGWAAALQLVSIRLSSQTDIQSYVDNLSGTNQFIVDYLLQEVISHLDEETRSFLLNTSIFNRFCPELCNAFLNKNNSDEIIKQLVSSNIFVIPLDSSGHFFRYHSLFRDFLRKSLLDSLTERARQEKFYKAFQDLKQYGEPSECFYMGIRAEAYRECSSLLMEDASSFMTRGMYSEIRMGLNAFPPDFLSYDPNLYALYLWFCTIRFEDPVIVFKGSENGFLQGIRALRDGYHLYLRNNRPDESQSSLEWGLDKIPRKYREILNTARDISGSVYFQMGDFKKAEEMFSYDLREDRFQRRFSSAVMQENKRINMFIERAAFAQAEKTLNDAFRSISTMGSDFNFGVTGLLWIDKALISLINNRLDDALQYIGKGSKHINETDYQGFRIFSEMVRGEILYAGSRYEESREVFYELHSSTIENAPWISDQAKAWIAAIQMKQGGDPLVWARSFSREWKLPLPRKDIVPFSHFREFLIYADYLVHSGHYGDAYRLLETMTNQCLENDHIYNLAKALIRMAVIQYKENCAIEAQVLLNRIFQLMGDEKPVYLFTEAGEDCLHLLSQTDKQGELPEYLKPYALSDPESSGKRSVRIHEMTETFNDREIDILKLMDKGCSNQEIGEAIYLSANTIRWYASQIYSKLDVKRRGEAVAKAHELGLI